jgi:hypothetical protein
MLLLEWNENAERTALPLYGLHGAVATVLTGEVLTELQSESGAFLAAGAIGRLSLMEDAVQTV